MTILAIDTTGSNCSVALRLTGRDDAVRIDPIGRGHAERLAPMVADLLADEEVKVADLDRIGVTVGPGSFAGTRVGVAFARGLALACGADIVGISNLAVFVRASAASGPVAAIHDARRGEAILQFWASPDAPGETQRLPQGEIADRLGVLGGPDALAVTGPGAHLARSAGYHQVGPEALDISALLDLVAVADPAEDLPSPFYARPPDAKLPGGVEPA